MAADSSLHLLIGIMIAAWAVMCCVSERSAVQTERGAGAGVVSLAPAACSVDTGGLHRASSLLFSPSPHSTDAVPWWGWLLIGSGVATLCAVGGLVVAVGTYCFHRGRREKCGSGPGLAKSSVRSYESVGKQFGGRPLNIEWGLDPSPMRAPRKARMPTKGRLRGQGKRAGSSTVTTKSLSKVGRLLLERAHNEDWFVPATEMVLYDMVGQGSGGAVYKGAWSGTTVAVKGIWGHLLLSRTGNDALSRQLNHFCSEVEMLSRLRHPNVLHFLGVTFAESTTFGIAVVTEYCKHGSLFEVIHSFRCVASDISSGSDGSEYASSDGNESLDGDAAQQGSLPRNEAESFDSGPSYPGLDLDSDYLQWRHVYKFLRDIARGMHYLHSREPPIIHRDLKSGNVLIKKDWSACISDFGLSRLVPEESRKGAPMTRNVGTPGWIAPEVMKDQRYNQSVDVYSFGVIMWELISAKVPYRGASLYKITRLVTEGDRPIVPDNCPPPYANLMRHCWAASPKVRPTFADILATWLPLLAEIDDEEYSLPMEALPEEEDDA